MRYLGNKTRMMKNIDSFIKEREITGETFCDLFTGSASVADFFKDRYIIIANDLLASSCVFANAKINNGNIPTFEKFRKNKQTDPFTYFSNKSYDFDDSHFIWKNYSPKNDRQFFTEDIANRIDGIRLELDDLIRNGIIDENEFNYLLGSLLETVMGLSNTTGTYEAFLKDWDKRAFKEFVLEPLEMKHSPLYSTNNTIYNKDSNELIREISGDILYLDTPYTVTDYNSAYHLLETITKYDNPEIRGKTGRRVKRPEKSHYTVLKKVPTAYEDLIRNARFKDIIISYSTQSLMPVDTLIKMLNKYSSEEVFVKYYPYREYKNIRSSQKGGNLREILIHMKKDIR